MACSPSSPCAPSLSHDVFLSFRGEDTRKGFTSHLYKALCLKGIGVFMDTELRRGEEISAALLTAIEASRASIIVFSRNYASSAWCLDELVKILECKKLKRQMVRPVFIDVDPSEVRNQTGSIGEAMARHQETCTEKAKVKRWRNVLKEAANLSGWHLGNRIESEFITMIVEEIFSKLNRTTLTVAKNPVGLDPKVQAVNAFLSIGSNDVRVVGIYGVGGIGKTTIAKGVYNMVANRFEGSSFLANVGATSKKHGVVRLQGTLLSDIMGEMDVMVGYVFNGIEMIKRNLRHKRIFLVLDDVDHPDQLEQLVGDKDWFGPGSRILITTGDENLLVSHGVDMRYEVDELHHDHAMELFSWNAFKEPCPRDQYKRHSNILLSVAHRIPLALIVLGSSLHCKSVKHWEDVLQKFKSMPDTDVNAIIKMSFDELGSNEESIFLDIACFFEGEDNGFVTKHLDRCNFDPDVGIQILRDRALIDIEYGKICMHEIIQEFGKEVVRQESPQEPGRRSRLWHHDDVLKVLEENSGTIAIQGIKLDFSGAEELVMRTNAIRKMKRLRLLMIRDSHFSGCPEYLCRDLSWLNIEDPLTHIPSTSHSSNKWVPEETVCDRINSSRGKANSGQGGCSDLKCFHVAPKRLLHFAMTVPRLFAHAMVSSSSIVRRKSSDKSCSPVHSGGLEQALKVEFETIKKFSLTEVYAATKHNSLTIGRGGSSSMYLGELSNGRRVAVKWLHGDRSIDIQHCFITELKIQARVKHKNIVTLLGYCFERGERLLVYDYMSNGTVCHHLDDEQSPYLMSWVNRMKVALEIARVIEYLHFCVVPPIIHRDIKTNNIMFDDEWTAVLLDFGDSIVLEEAESAFAGIRGTRGYLDPESLLSSKWTISSDVYSFGVVLLELLTGSQAVYMDENRHRHHLVDLAMQNIGDSHFMDILDRRLQPLSSSFELEAIMRVYQLARACIRRKGKDRPSMIEVVRRLDDALAIYVTGAPGNKITEQYPDSDDLPTPLNEFMEAGSSSPSLSVASSRLEDIPRD